MIALYGDVASMLTAHHLNAPETAFEHDGYSGATMARIEQHGERYVVKRVSRTTDWIIQMTSDHAMREAQIAASDVLSALAPALRSPSIAAARDGDGFALLMRDLTSYLLPADGVLREPVWDVILAGAASMHARFWEAAPPAGIGWCGLRERLLMLSEPAGERLRDAGLMEFGFAAGWERFHAQAPPAAGALVRQLHAAPHALVDELVRLPQTLLHHDLKTANVAVEGDTLWLFDWALAGYGPVGVELAWLLAVNSSRLPWTLDETAERYRAHLQRQLGARIDEAAWRRQLAAAYISGLAMYGFAKDGDELAWWCERAVEAQRVLGL